MGSLLVFVLATFCWTKSLLCNVAAFTGMLLYPKSTLQLCSSRRFCEVFKKVHSGSLSAVRKKWYSIRTLISQQHPSGRSLVSNIRPDDVVFCPNAHQPATSIRTMRTFRSDAHQCLEASNSSRLHPSGRNGKSSGRYSEFEKNPAFKCIRPDDVAIPSGRHSVFDKH
jgi:hypothetical protein